MEQLIDAEATTKNLSATINVLRELEHVKQELAKLKLKKDSVLEEKTQGEKKAEAFSLKILANLSLVDTVKKEIEQINEEKMLVELATIECRREFEAIQAQRKREAEEYLGKTDEVIKKVNYIKELEMKLSATNLDVNKIECELELVKKKEELVSIKQQGFKFMESMDLVRIELKNVKEKLLSLKKEAEKADLALEKANSKSLRAKVKLEEISGAEQNAKSLTTDMSHTLQQLKLEAEKSTEEAKLIREECSKLKDFISKTEHDRELNHKRLDSTLRELEEVKLSESEAISHLNMMNEKTLRARVKKYHDNSRITISNLEYKYLKEREAKANEIADKKVAAARISIDALKASEKEILMKAKIVEGERVKNVRVASPSPKGTMNRGIRSPARRGKFVKGSSPLNQKMHTSPGFVVRKRREVMPSLAKFFTRNRKSIERV